MSEEIKDEIQFESFDGFEADEVLSVPNMEQEKEPSEQEVVEEPQVGVAEAMSEVMKALSSAQQKVVFDADEKEETEEPEETEESKDPDAGLTEEELVDKYICNVFERGFVDVPFIMDIPCSACMFKRKRAKEMVVYKNKMLHRIFPGEEKLPSDKVVGLVTMCQNCGHVDVFGCDIDDILLYLRGKSKK